MVKLIKIQTLLILKLQKKVKKYEDSLLLEDEAIEALSKLRKFEERYQQGLKAEAEAQRVQAQKNYEATLKNIEKEIMDSEEIIPGIKLSKEEKKKFIRRIYQSRF